MTVESVKDELRKAARQRRQGRDTDSTAQGLLEVWRKLLGDR